MTLGFDTCRWCSAIIHVMSAGSQQDQPIWAAVDTGLPMPTGHRAPGWLSCPKSEDERGGHKPVPVPVDDAAKLRKWLNTP